MTSSGTNWAGNYTYGAARVERPVSIDELAELVAATSQVRALGSRHSFSDLTDTEGVLVDLAALPHAIRVHEDTPSVSLGGGVRYGDLALNLEARGWALANLASLPHISVAGAVATGTHGSGDRNGCLAAAVRAVDVMGPDGEVRRLERGDADFDGSVGALGAVGVVTRLELDIEPTYHVRQEVRTGLRWATVESRFDNITAAGYSVSMFTRFDDDEVIQLWIKSRDDDQSLVEVFGTVAAAEPQHMLIGGSTDALTGQGGIRAPWLERLPHFRMGFIPSMGEELQSEYFVRREDAVEALAALRHVAPAFTHLLLGTEVRTIAADDLWLSGAQGRATAGFHFTWVRDEPAVRAAVRIIEDTLAPYSARPHWGKIFETGGRALQHVYPRLTDFAALRDRVDPDHVFGNAFVDRVLAEA